MYEFFRDLQAAGFVALIYGVVMASFVLGLFLGMLIG